MREKQQTDKFFGQSSECQHHGCEHDHNGQKDDDVPADEKSDEIELQAEVTNEMLETLAKSFEAYCKLPKCAGDHSTQPVRHPKIDEDDYDPKATTFKIDYVDDRLTEWIEIEKGIFGHVLQGMKDLKTDVEHQRPDAFNLELAWSDRMTARCDTLIKARVLHPLDVLDFGLCSAQLFNVEKIFGYEKELYDAVGVAYYDRHKRPVPNDTVTEVQQQMKSQNEKLTKRAAKKKSKREVKKTGIDAAVAEWRRL